MFGADEKHEKEFFEAIGRAVLQWQRVERSLGVIYLWLIRGEMHLAAAAYHQIIGLNARLSMIDAAIKLALKDDSLGNEWKKLYPEVRRQARRRNILVHSDPFVNWSENGPHTLELGRAMFDTRDKGERIDYDLNDVVEFGESFVELATKLDSFSDRIVKRKRRKNI